jgi:hypothetical protein
MPRDSASPYNLLQNVFSNSVFFLSLCGLIVTGCSDGSSSSVGTRDIQTTRCIDNVSPSDRHVFQCDGVEFKVFLTQDCIDQACGLIFDVHGWNSNPDEQEGRSNLARAAADNGGYIVVQPGELSQPSSWSPDLHYSIVFDFMQQAIDAFDVDRKRVHFSGFSQGGMMTWKFICEHSDIIASAAPVSATELDCFRNGSGPPSEIPIFLISGTQDIAIPYYLSDRAWSISETLVSVMYDYGMVTMDAASYKFSEAGGIIIDETGMIDVAREGIRFQIVDGSESNSYLWTRYTSLNNVAFEHLRHDNGHVYPDNPDSLIFPEDPAVWFSIGEAILQFFVENPRD